MLKNVIKTDCEKRFNELGAAFKNWILSDNKNLFKAQTNYTNATVNFITFNEKKKRES